MRCSAPLGSRDASIRKTHPVSNKHGAAAHGGRSWCGCVHVGASVNVVPRATPPDMFYWGGLIIAGGAEHVGGHGPGSGIDWGFRVCASTLGSAMVSGGFMFKCFKKCTPS